MSLNIETRIIPRCPRKNHLRNPKGGGWTMKYLGQGAEGRIASLRAPGGSRPRRENSSRVVCVPAGPGQGQGAMHPASRSPVFRWLRCLPG